ncbi:MAG TPA: WD40 repeat domain-containing protein [Polyangia bacterium]|jgi:WD40 repeat protein
MRLRVPLPLAAALVGVALACSHTARIPTLASAISDVRSSSPDLRVIGVPPWAHLDGTWGSYPITHGSIETAAFRGDGRLVTLNENDGTLRVWDVRSRTAIAAHERCPPPADGSAHDFTSYNRYTLALSPDGRLAAVGYGDGSVCVRRLDDGVVEGNFRTGPSALRYLSFWGATRLVSYSHQISTGEEQVPPPCSPHCPASPPDGFLRLWDVRSGQQVAELQVGDLPSDEKGRPALATSLDGSRIVVPRGHQVSAIDLGTMKAIWSRRLDGQVWRLALSAGDRIVVVTDRSPAGGGPRVRELGLDDGRDLGSADVPSFELVAIDSRGPWAVTREASGENRPNREVQLWDVPRMRLRKTASRFAGASGCRDEPMPSGKGAFSPDGSVLATWGDGVTLWNVERLAPFPHGVGHCENVTQLALSPDGSRALSVSSDETIREWRVSDGAELRRWTRRAASATFSPDGGRILIGGGAVVSVLAAETGRVVWEVGGRVWGAPAAFSPDGAFVATVGTREDLTVHDARTGRTLWSQGTRSNGTHLLTFTPDGKYLVANAETRELAVWEARTGRFVRSLGRSAQVVAMRRDGSIVLQENHRAILLPVEGSPAVIQAKVSLGFPMFLLTKNENQVLVAEGNRVTLRRLDDGSDLGHIDLGPFDDSATGLALSPDGTRLLVGTRRGVVLSFALGSTP